MNWHISSRCSGGDCVALAPAPDGGVVVRDTKQAGQLNEMQLHFTRAEFAAFLEAAKRGEFDHLVEP
jgi:hypothetical protein